jgi:hypothetical protein
MGSMCIVHSCAREFINSGTVLNGGDLASPPLSPRIWAHIRMRYWSAKIDKTSLFDPLS